MKLFNLKETYSGDIVPRSTEVTYCGVSIFRDACYQLVSAFLITYITFAGVLGTGDSYLAQMSVINIIMIICLIWDGINDPIMGWIIEKVHFKSGKYKPWILIGALGNTVVVLTLFLARPTGWGFVALFGVFYFLWDLVWTINDIAYWSMLPSLTRDEKIRNRITSVMQICISIGVFAVYGAVPMLVRAGHQAHDYGVIAIVVTLLFLLSQIALVFVCKEHKRDEQIEKQEQKDASFKDMFILLKKNVPFRKNMIAILLNYLGGGVLVGFAVYYFYLMYGYGSNGGGTIQFIFTIMYAIGTLIAQVAYPFLSKILNRKKLTLIGTISFTVGYAGMFLLGFPLFTNSPIATGNLIFLLYLCGIIIFFGQGIHAVLIIIQMQSTIEYNEWKFGERKESIASSVRALIAKFGSAIQRLLIYLTLTLSGLYAITTEISNIEYMSNAKEGAFGQMNTEQIAEYINSNIIQGIHNWQFVVLAIGMIIIPAILMLISAIIAYRFEIDENSYSKMLDDLKARENHI